MVCLLSFINTWSLASDCVTNTNHGIAPPPPQSLTKPIFAQPKSKKPKKDYPILTHQS